MAPAAGGVRRPRRFWRRLFEGRPRRRRAEAQKILRAQLDGHESEWVFPSPEGRPYSRVHISRVFRKAARAAGLRDFHFHDLRHHDATMALN